MKGFMANSNTLNRLIVALTLSSCLLGCSNDLSTADAFGNFEATEITISSEANGKLLVFDVEEGRLLQKDERVGLVDTLQLVLQRDQFEASRRAVYSRIPGVVAQIEVLEEQKRVAEIEADRINKLLQDQAATQKQWDDINGRISVLDRQIRSIRTQNATILSELEAVDAQIAQINDVIDKCSIVNPVTGTVLVTYAEPFELTSQGRPLYKLADLETMYLRAYITGSQLPHIRLGQQVTVQIDEDEDTNRSLSGEISWISSQAEFTPNLIQTKEERVNLVYAFRVRVSNMDGSLKIGMPGEVIIE